MPYNGSAKLRNSGVSGVWGSRVAGNSEFPHPIVPDMRKLDNTRITVRRNSAPRGFQNPRPPERRFPELQKSGLRGARNAGILEPWIPRVSPIRRDLPGLYGDPFRIHFIVSPRLAASFRIVTKSRQVSSSHTKSCEVFPLHRPCPALVSPKLVMPFR